MSNTNNTKHALFYLIIWFWGHTKVEKMPKMMPNGGIKVKCACFVLLILPIHFYNKLVKIGRSIDIITIIINECIFAYFTFFVCFCIFFYILRHFTLFTRMAIKQILPGCGRSTQLFLFPHTCP